MERMRLKPLVYIFSITFFPSVKKNPYILHEKNFLDKTTVIPADLRTHYCCNAHLRSHQGQLSHLFRSEAPLQLTLSVCL